MLTRQTKYLVTFFVLSITICTIWVGGFILFASYTVPSSTPDISDTSAEAIVALTGGKNRLTEAIQLLSNNQSGRLFISGVGEKANLINTLILSGPLPDNISQLLDKIEIGHDATDTEGNAKETSEWARKNGIKSIYLVTANYHMPRSLIAFQQYAQELTIYPYPIFSPHVETKDWFKSDGSKRLLISEYNKYIAAYLKLFLGI